mgnify:FL=1
MKVGQIIKVKKSGLTRFAPGIAQRLDGEVGLVVQEKYDLAYKVRNGVRVFPSIVRFESLKGFDMCEDGVMLYRGDVEVLS